ASPYSTYSYAAYTFERASAEARFKKRMYRRYASSEDSASIPVPDLTYLVEPVEGVWLLGIDANVFALSQRVDTKNPENPANFVSSGNAGWNRMLVEKRHVMTWIKNVVDQAATLNKQLIAFSHYPMLDTTRGAGSDIAAFFGTERRQPTAETMREMAGTGLHLHLGGHLHKNNTAVLESEDSFLVDIQIPSIAAYMPAFKLLTLHSDDRIEIETVTLDNVPGFDDLFEHYRMEQACLTQNNSPTLWHAGILESKSYREFTQWHLTELTRRRYLPRDWPKEMREYFERVTGTSLLTLLALNTGVRLSDVRAVACSEPDLLTKLSDHTLPDSADDNLYLKKLIADWRAAEYVVMEELQKNGISRESVDGIDGLMIASDFYRLSSAGGSLAAKDIEPRRRFYTIARTLMNASAIHSSPDTDAESDEFAPVGMYYKRQSCLLLNILHQLAKGLPNDHFMIDFKQRHLRVIG
ncbi:hypothetical protein LJB97_04285, partial [Parabacteroides sp. OttesenSCG-928-O15]|nr:hypothetical protein [Parabacteroides sp. OttesenSCG-928-O15]